MLERQLLDEPVDDIGLSPGQTKFIRRAVKQANKTRAKSANSTRPLSSSHSATKTPHPTEPNLSNAKCWPPQLVVPATSAFKHNDDDVVFPSSSISRPQSAYTRSPRAKSAFKRPPTAPSPFQQIEKKEAAEHKTGQGDDQAIEFDVLGLPIVNVKIAPEDLQQSTPLPTSAFKRPSLRQPGIRQGSAAVVSFAVGQLADSGDSKPGLVDDEFHGQLVEEWKASDDTRKEDDESNTPSVADPCENQANDSASTLSSESSDDSVPSLTEFPILPPRLKSATEARVSLKSTPTPVIVQSRRESLTPSIHVQVMGAVEQLGSRRGSVVQQPSLFQERQGDEGAQGRKVEGGLSPMTDVSMVPSRRGSAMPGGVERRRGSLILNAENGAERMIDTQMGPVSETTGEKSNGAISSLAQRYKTFAEPPVLTTPEQTTTERTLLSRRASTIRPPQPTTRRRREEPNPLDIEMRQAIKDLKSWTSKHLDDPQPVLTSCIPTYLLQSFQLSTKQPENHLSISTSVRVSQVNPSNDLSSTHSLLPTPLPSTLAPQPPANSVVSPNIPLLSPLISSSMASLTPTNVQSSQSSLNGNPSAGVGGGSTSQALEEIFLSKKKVEREALRKVKVGVEECPPEGLVARLREAGVLAGKKVGEGGELVDTMGRAYEPFRFENASKPKKKKPTFTVSAKPEMPFFNTQKEARRWMRQRKLEKEGVSRRLKYGAWFLPIEQYYNSALNKLPVDSSDLRLPSSLSQEAAISNYLNEIGKKLAQQRSQMSHSLALMGETLVIGGEGVPAITMTTHE
ncbi:hypothetical protein HDV05_005254 [Chytridiales sp. JEL 0842]|nr:hypothetical protein HDV05_005254 [Chytridiales sp. JEL 0842]